MVGVLEVVLGLAAGIFGGIMGIGGGMIMIPALVLLGGVEQHLAQGVSLAVVTVTSLVGAVAHYRQGNVRLGVAILVAPSAILFAFIGARLALGLDPIALRRIFGVVVVAMALLMLVQRPPEPKEA